MGDNANLQEALRYQELGWNVVAAPPRGKSPLGNWKRLQTERVVERELRDAFADSDRNLFVITGAVSQLVVLDCDEEDAVHRWYEELGDVLKQTARVKTGKGWHFYFRIPDGTPAPRNKSGDGWDLRGEGGGVVAPPSVHESGRRYEWAEDHGPDAIQDAPPGLLGDIGDTREGEKDARSVLAHLLTHVPAEGGRNNWLAQVAGHYAKHLPYWDAYEIHTREAAARLNPALPEHEIAKLLHSIWNAERAKQGVGVPDVEEGDNENEWRKNLVEPAEATGWLVSAGDRVLVQERTKDSEGHYELGLAPWMDCDMRVLSVVDTDRGRVYEIELIQPDGQRTEETLPAATIADSRKLAGWLADRGRSVGPPDTMFPARMKEGTRLVRYLEAQEVEAHAAVPALGWHEDSAAFITHDGIIRVDGPAGFEDVRPDPAVRGWAPYHYGHNGKPDAVEVLQEVLTFHDPRVAAVFGAWWAACLLKPQITEVASQFPFMALEAPSESGKTTGFFPLMLQLAGSRGGQSNPTRAALRDYLSAHRSGIVWVDDLDSLEAHGELLRNVTVGGSIIKKGEGNHDQVVAVMRAALVVSGENLGLHGQKALLDRAVLLDVPSPTARKSARGDYPQWDDVLELRRKHPDLTEFAGSVVELALAQADLVAEYKKLRKGSGRASDKDAVVRVGARILSRMLGGADWIVDQVEEWSAGVKDSGSENVLTLKVLPAALSRTGWKQKPEGPDPSRRMVATPAFVEDDTVWFSPKLLATWWEREPPARKIDQRVESEEALTQQARALGMGGDLGVDQPRRRFRFVTGEGTSIYWRCPPGISQLLLSRSRGEEDEEQEVEKKPDQQEL